MTRLVQPRITSALLLCLCLKHLLMPQLRETAGSVVFLSPADHRCGEVPTSASERVVKVIDSGETTVLSNISTASVI